MVNKNQPNNGKSEGDLSSLAGQAPETEIMENTNHEPGRESKIPNPPKRTSWFPNVDGYEILDVLGSGGMGIVYRALDKRLNRHVAIKTLKNVDRKELATQRIQTEAASLAQIQHPGVVQIFEVGTCEARNEKDSVPFIAMELVEGPSLAGAIQNQQMTSRQAAEVIYELTKALSVCHEQGIVHRDLKPGNVLMTSPVEPKLTDFGLAKILHSEQRLTRTGDVMGTPGYMSPEQASGVVKNIGPSADVYGLGAILYELLTGQPPFQAPDAVQTMMKVLTEDPQPPSTIQSKIPRDLETIALKCLEKKPKHRYTTCEELAHDLKRFLRNEPIFAKPTPVHRKVSMWCKRHPVWTSLIGLATAASIIGVIATGFHIQSLQQELDRSKRIIDEGRALSIWLLDDFT